MATQKTPVDHSAISGTKVEEKPKSDFMAAMEKITSPATVKLAEGLLPPDLNGKKPGGLLASIRRGRMPMPPRILLAGTEGIGKSTFAAKAPNAIFIPTEDGLNEIDCAKFSWMDNGVERYKANTFEEVRNAALAIATQAHDFSTLAVDSVDWLERLIWDNVSRRFGKKNIEDIGYAKGYIYALDEWRELLEIFEKCRARGMAIVLISHTKIEKFEDPEFPTYDRYSPRLHKHAQALLTEWVDAVLFATRRMTMKKESKDSDSREIAQPVGAAGGERIIKTTGSPTCIAKNRYNLPPEIPLSWDSFNEHLAKFMTGSAA